MAAPIKISRNDLDPAGLRRAARRSGDVAAARRMLAVALVPDNITLLRLPPYSPELNPVANVGAYLRSDKLSNRVFDS